jgi:hypothetical protein
MLQTRTDKNMRRFLQFALALSLLTGVASAQVLGPGAAAPTPEKPQKKEKKRRPEGVEWMWQYSPPPADGRQNELLRDDRFQPLLEEYLTAPQAFWGPEGAARKSLADTAYDFLSVPGQVIADQDRYLSITGCVFHFCSDRGLLWVDLNAKYPLILFAAIAWSSEGKPAADPGAAYTLWVFPDQPLTATKEAPNRLPPAFLASIARWTGKPVPGQTHLQNITAAVLVDPDGTPHKLTPAELGVSGGETKTKP